MKKLLLLLVLLQGLSTTFAQEGGTSFPYGKMLRMTPDELQDAKFKYDGDKNQYILTKLNGLNQTASILGALSGTPQNYVPHVDDYRILIQGGESDYSSINVLFYDSKVYDKVYEFATTCGIDLIETGTGNLKFSYSDYAFELTRNTVGQSASESHRGSTASRDQSYTVYNFAIFTGVPPFSDWHTKQAIKEQKREAKGKKKQSVSDLM